MLFLYTILTLFLSHLKYYLYNEMPERNIIQVG